MPSVDARFPIFCAVPDGVESAENEGVAAVLTLSKSAAHARTVSAGRRRMMNASGRGTSALWALYTFSVLVPARHQSPVPRMRYAAPDSAPAASLYDAPITTSS